MTDRSQPFTVERFLKYVPHIASLGIEFERSDESGFVFALPYQDRLVAYEETGVMAGGAIFSLMDTACGAAVFAARNDFGPTATLDLRLDYLKPATPHLTVYAHAECYKLTRHIGFVRGTASHGDVQDPIAFATGTFMISSFDPETSRTAAREV